MLRSRTVPAAPPRTHRFGRYLPAILIACCLWPAPDASGQTTFASIVGTVRDSSGSVAPGVAVMAVNAATGERETQKTGETGAYSFVTLHPGTYSIRAEAPGFRLVEVRNIVLQVNQAARFDLTLEVGQVTDRIDVTAPLTVLATETSEMGRVTANEEIVSLPLNGRNYMQLAELTNGVVIQGTSESGGPNIVGDGGRYMQNSFLLEGVESRTQREGGYGMNLSVDAIGEFKILQNAFSAEFGRGTTIVNATLRSGTNSLHGSLFEFIRNDAVDARNAFDLTGLVPALRMNQFGASIGGPIRKNRTFFFANYEGQRIRRGGTTYVNVPTAEMLAGRLTSAAIDPTTGVPIPGNVIPDNRISQFARVAARYYPAPTPYKLPQANYAVVLKHPTTTNQGTGKIDHNFGTSDRLSGSVNFSRYERIQAGSLPFTGAYSSSDVQPRVSVEHTHTFSPHLLNNLRYGFSRTSSYSGPDTLADHDITKDMGLKNLSVEPRAYALPTIVLDGYGTIGSPEYSPSGATDANHQVIEQITYMKSRHTLKAGVDLRHLRYDDLGYATQNGRYTFTRSMYTRNAIADLLLGLPQEAYAAQSGGNGFSALLRNGEYSFYLQDDIKVARRFTLNAGVRYELVQWPLEANNEQSNWNFRTGRIEIAGKELPRRLVPTDKNNLSPRLGFAWTPASLPRTVIRSGAAIIYGNFRQVDVVSMHFNPPFVVDNFQFNELPLPKFSTATLFPPMTALDKYDYRNITINYQAPKETPMVYQWNFNIQHAILRNLLFEVGYAGNRGVHQQNRWDANQAAPDVNLSRPTPIQSRRPYQNIGFVSAFGTQAWSNYNALKVRVERRFANGFSMQATYTFAKNLGLRATGQWVVQDVNNLRLNYGPTNQDYRHRSVNNWVYELPFGRRVWGGAPAPVKAAIAGWQLNGIATLRSGPAITLASNVSNNRGNRFGNKPDRIADGTLPADQRNTEGWFDVRAFRNPVAGAYGNSGEGVMRGPGALNFDLSVFRNIRIAEKKTLQVRAEGFNAFNHVNLGNPGANSSNANNFGKIRSAATGRELQAGLKLIF
jgi:hypothetical protein